MKSAAFACAFILAASPAFALDPKAPDSCATGPVEKTYGGTPWLVASCSDGKSLVFVAKEGSQAAPFEFDLTYTGDGYDLNGHGEGERKFTDTAYAELQKLTGKDVLELLLATKTAKAVK
jgi:hypothetical protein